MRRLLAEDFRKDIPKNTAPTLILHGDADRILPPDATSRRQAKMIKNVKFVELPGGPHGVLWAHAEQINKELCVFWVDGRPSRVSECSRIQPTKSADTFRHRDR